MNGKTLCDKHFSMTEERLKLEKVINEIFSEIDWLHPDYFGLDKERCDDDCKVFTFEIPNYIHQISEHNNKIHNILFSNGYVDSKEIPYSMVKINNVNTIIYKNPLFVVIDLMDCVVKTEFSKNGINFAKFKGNNSVDPFYSLTISKSAMMKL